MANGSPTEGEPMVRDSRDLIIFRRRLFQSEGARKEYLEDQSITPRF